MLYGKVWQILSFEARLEKRSGSLDILRAVAILLVLGNHLAPCPDGYPAFLRVPTMLWRKGGWVGVDLFFVLSGFLISGLLFKEHRQRGRISFKRFFIRRGFKIYPPFYVLILALVLPNMIFHHSIDLTGIFSELFFLQDYIPGLLPVTWSLGVEEKFYILLPMLLIFITSVHKSTQEDFDSLPRIFIVISTVCLALRILNSVRPYTHLTHLFPFHLRMDSLFFGVLISYYYHYKSAAFTGLVRRLKYLLIGLGMALFVPAFIFPRASTIFLPIFGLTLFYFASGLIISASVDANVKANIFTNTLMCIGRHSYAIYLWHGLIMRKVVYYFGYSWPIYAVAYFLGSILTGILLTKMVDQPVLKLRDKWFPSRSNALV